MFQCRCQPYLYLTTVKFFVDKLPYELGKRLVPLDRTPPFIVLGSVLHFLTWFLLLFSSGDLSSTTASLYEIFLWRIFRIFKSTIELEAIFIFLNKIYLAYSIIFSLFFRCATTVFVLYGICIILQTLLTLSSVSGPLSYNQLNNNLV